MRLRRRYRRWIFLPQSWFQEVWLDVRCWWLTREHGALFVAASALSVIIVFVAVTSHLADKEKVNRDLRCLAKNIYYEARGESDQGQRAVAEVTMNRVASPRYPDSVCKVVYQRGWDKRRGRYVGAFSWTELDLSNLNAADRKAWKRAVRAAKAVYFEEAAPTVSGALFYHAARIQPAWAPEKEAVATIGNHIFYR